MVYYDPEFDAPTVPDGEDENDTTVDQNVLNALPPDHRVLQARTHGASFWARTSRIDTVSPDGQEVAYFLKVSSGEEGRNMVFAEFESMKALHAVIATHIPLPIAWGTLAKEPDKHFYLASFCAMEDELPSISEFTAVMAELHQKSVSPTGQFGFHVTTYGGNQPVDNTWCSSWEEFYTRAMRNTVKNESIVQGPNEELNQLTDDLCTKVIPRLLRPLETGGRSIKPSLVHGDLWHGNVGIDIATNDPILFDACSLYAHNEFEMVFWRASRYRTNRQHVRAYHKLVEISAPLEDHDDRNALYALRIDLLVSALYPSNKRMRQLAMEEIEASGREISQWIRRLPRESQCSTGVNRARFDEQSDESMFTFHASGSGIRSAAVACAYPLFPPHRSILLDCKDCETGSDGTEAAEQSDGHPLTTPIDSQRRIGYSVRSWDKPQVFSPVQWETQSCHRRLSYQLLFLHALR